MLAAAAFQQILQVIQQGRGNVNLPNVFLDRAQLVAADHLGQHGQEVAPALAGEHFALAGAVGEAELQTHQEAVELAFRQGERADLLAGILRGDDEKTAAAAGG